MMKNFAVQCGCILAILLGSLGLVNCGSSGNKLEKINVTPANATLAKGTNQQFVAEAVYSDGTQQSIGDQVTWNSATATVAPVTAQGEVTAMAEGASQISAAYQGVTGNTYVTVGPPVLVAISVTPTPSSLPVGESEQLTATGAYSDGSTQNLTQSVTWASSGTSVAAVGPTGSVQAQGVGTATITAASGSVNGAAALNVGQTVLLSISVTPTPSSLPLGESEQLIATGKFSDGSTQDLTNSSTWSTSGSAVASVSASGSVQANGNGAAIITASSGSVSGNASVNVGQAALLGITVAPAQSSLPVGESEQLIATGNYSDGSTQNLTQTVSWTSSGGASVGSSGAVVADAVGSATINASVGSVTGTAAVTVTPAVVISIAVQPSTLSVVLGGTGQFHAIGTWSDGSTQDVTSSASWNATPAAMASISSSGTVSAQQVGTTTIFATYSGATGTANFTVIPLFLVTYFNRANAVASGYDATLRVANPGLTAGSPNQGNLCADIYVFDDAQELTECCGCYVSDSGYLELSVINDLTSNPLTGVSPTVGSVMMIPSDLSTNPQCNAANPNPTGALDAWQTNDQSNGDGTYTITESSYDSLALQSGMESNLAGLCSALQTLGSGQGVCSCGSGESATKRHSKKH